VSLGGGRFRAIEKIGQGDSVKSRSELSRMIGERPVTQTWIHHRKRTIALALDTGETLSTTASHRFFTFDRGLVSAGELNVGDRLQTLSEHPATITFDHETLRCTPRHRFFTTSGWVAAGDLSPGCEVRCLDGKMHEIFAVSVEPAETPVFNMRVDQQHTYFVGQAGYLVHNEKDQNTDDGTQGDNIPGSTDVKKKSPMPSKPNLASCSEQTLANRSTRRLPFLNRQSLLHFEYNLKNREKHTVSAMR
jgi:hypothetical protein